MDQINHTRKIRHSPYLPSTGCPTNGPDLTGTRVAIVSFWGDEGTGNETCLPSTGCPTNGPDLTGTRIHAKISPHLTSLPIRWDELGPVNEQDSSQTVSASPVVVR